MTDGSAWLSSAPRRSSMIRRPSSFTQFTPSFETACPILYVRPGAASAEHFFHPVPQLVQRKYYMLVEAPELAQLDDRVPRYGDDLAHGLMHVDKGDMAQIFSIGLVHRPGRKIDPDEIVEDERLRGLRKLGAAVGQVEFRGIENFPDLLPFHGGTGPHPRLEFLPVERDQTPAFPPG